MFSFGVRYRNHLRIKKYAIRMATEKAERGEMEHIAGPSHEVPFGIRAIERGCEVEGVWNSRTATPLQSARPTPQSSPMLAPTRKLRKKRNSSMSTLSKLETAVATSAFKDRATTPTESAQTTEDSALSRGSQASANARTSHQPDQGLRDRRSSLRRFLGHDGAESIRLPISDGKAWLICFALDGPHACAPTRLPVLID